MKKYLPKSFNNPHLGFTLVELLVVVAIIAILAVIGLTIFSNLQKGARDARRKGDIDSISQAMEANYGKTTSGTYDAMADGMFASGKVPTDPINTGTTCSANNCKYCVRATAGACTTETTVAVGVPASGTSYNVCASLESNTGPGGTAFYCKSAQQ